MIDTKTDLLIQAEQLMRARGYSGFSYAHLADAVGIRKASIYHHFPNKELLVASVLQSYKDRYDVRLAAIEAEHCNALDRIEAYGRLFQMGIDAGLGCLCAALLTELSTLPELLRAKTSAFFEGHLSWLERIYAEGLRKEEVCSTLRSQEAAKLIVASFEGALMIERILDGSAGFDMTLSAILKSLSPPSASPNASVVAA